MGLHAKPPTWTVWFRRLRPIGALAMLAVAVVLLALGRPEPGPVPNYTGVDRPPAETTLEPSGLPSGVRTAAPAETTAQPSPATSRVNRSPYAVPGLPDPGGQPIGQRTVTPRGTTPPAEPIDGKPGRGCGSRPPVPGPPTCS
jgi:hypothetical protein